MRQTGLGARASPTARQDERKEKTKQINDACRQDLRQGLLT